MIYMKNIIAICTVLFLMGCAKLDNNTSAPSVSTTDASSITSYTVITGGNIISNGGLDITSKGVVWSTINNPTIMLSTKTNEGPGSAMFTSTITGLTANTKYYVRAYAINTKGISYGNEISFTTRPIDFGNVTSATGKIWMDRNLGASRVATSSNDTSAYGDLYQWGRGNDLHQLRKSVTSTTLSATDVPGNSNFILTSSAPNDWRAPQNVNLWQGVNGTNNPCPTGYRIPTEAEWNAEIASWTTKNTDGAFASPLKLTMAGSREATITNTGVNGSYWSSTISGEGARYLYFGNAGSYTLTHNRSYGGSIRCIKD
jgi:uncharacterized protein (TIGR02145 family)